MVAEAGLQRQDKINPCNADHAVLHGFTVIMLMLFYAFLCMGD